MGHRRLPNEQCRLVGSIGGLAQVLEPERHDARPGDECAACSTKRGGGSTKGTAESG
jgi:hypothetical protein